MYRKTLNVKYLWVTSSQEWSQMDIIYKKQIWTREKIKTFHNIMSF